MIQASSLNPATVPLAVAAIAGTHVLPYARLQGTCIYLVAGVAVSAGGLVLTMVLKAAAFPYVLLFIMAAAYGIAAVFLYRHAARVAREGGDRTSAPAAV